MTSKTDRPKSPPVHPAFVLQHQRGSEPSIRERQSHSLNAAKRASKRQPSMPKFNLKEE